MKFSMKPYLPTLVISIILLVMVFLPWATASGLGVTVTFNGLEVNISGLGYLTLIMSVIGAGLSFIAVPRVRSLGTVFAGILAIIGVAVYWSRLQGLGVGYGLIIALIASLGLIAVGYLEYRKLEQPGKPKQPTQSTPPPPPPPQQ